MPVVHRHHQREQFGVGEVATIALAGDGVVERLGLVRKVV
jgi:hypothetical protein